LHNQSVNQNFTRKLSLTHLVGARWYHLRRVLHNWSDPDCCRVLIQTKAAFTPGFSKLLIQENVLPNRGCPKRGALGDIAMMQHTGMERSEDQWRQLLSQAGFEILRIWWAELGTTAIIEADLKGEETSSATNRFVTQANGPTLPANEPAIGANDSNGAFSHPITATSLAETAESSLRSQPVILSA